MVTEDCYPLLEHKYVGIYLVHVELHGANSSTPNVSCTCASTGQ